MAGSVQEVPARHSRLLGLLAPDGLRRSSYIGLAVKARCRVVLGRLRFCDNGNPTQSRPRGGRAHAKTEDGEPVVA